MALPSTLGRRPNLRLLVGTDRPWLLWQPRWYLVSLRRTPSLRLLVKRRSRPRLTANTPIPSAEAPVCSASSCSGTNLQWPKTEQSGHSWLYLYVPSRDQQIGMNWIDILNRLCHAESQAEDLVAAASQLLHMFLPALPYQPNQLQQSRRSELQSCMWESASHMAADSVFQQSISHLINHCSAQDMLSASHCGDVIASKLHRTELWLHANTEDESHVLSNSQVWQSLKI